MWGSLYAMLDREMRQSLAALEQARAARQRDLWVHDPQVKAQAAERMENVGNVPGVTPH